MKSDLICELILFWTINQFIRLQGTRVAIDLLRTIHVDESPRPCIVDQWSDFCHKLNFVEVLFKLIIAENRSAADLVPLKQSLCIVSS